MVCTAFIKSVDIILFYLLSIELITLKDFHTKEIWNKSSSRKNHFKKSFKKRSCVVNQNASQKNACLVKLLDNIIRAGNTSIS